MHIKYIKLLLAIFIIFFTTPLYSKKDTKDQFNSKNFSNYFSAVIAYDNNKNSEALKFFNLSKNLTNKHKSFLKQHIYSLIIDGKVGPAIIKLKSNLKRENSIFFESYFLLALDSINKRNFDKSDEYLEKLSKFKDEGVIENIIYESLKSYTYLFENKEIIPTNFGTLSYVSQALQNCYLDTAQTPIFFKNLINNDAIDSARYKFFYINYLIKNNNLELLKEIANEIDPLNSTLLTYQTKKWIQKKEFKKIGSIFSCQKESDILSEFFYIIANLYSSQDDLEKSNFYLNISFFLNPKFKYNLSLSSENYYYNKNYEQVKRILKNFNKNEEVYYWYKIKKKTNIISEKYSEEKAFGYINLELENLEDLSSKVLFDMANISKNFKKYKIAIDYYNKLLLKKKLRPNSYAEILYRRGGSHERLGDFKKSDKDLQEALQIRPDDAYILNYLAYSWLERNYKIDEAILMLKRAYELKKNDPFILDSVGWGYFLIDDFVNAEIFLKLAIQYMPDDPTVNEHYGDVLWKLDRKIEAKYYWQSVLNFKETTDDIKKNIRIKILNGIKKI